MVVDDNSLKLAHALYFELSQARKLDFVKGIDALVYVDNDIVQQPHQQLISMSKLCPMHPNSTKLYVRFCPSISIETLNKIKEYVESKYGFSCVICVWSIPIRMDIELKPK